MIFRDRNVSKIECRKGLVVRHEGGHHFILARVGNHRVALISLENGNRWAADVKVAELPLLSESEWHEVTDGDSAAFTPVGHARDVISIK